MVEFVLLSKYEAIETPTLWNINADLCKIL